MLFRLIVQGLSCRRLDFGPDVLTFIQKADSLLLHTEPWGCWSSKQAQQAKARSHPGQVFTGPRIEKHSSAVRLTPVDSGASPVSLMRMSWERVAEAKWIHFLKPSRRSRLIDCLKTALLHIVLMSNIATVVVKPNARKLKRPSTPC